MSKPRAWGTVCCRVGGGSERVTLAAQGIAQELLRTLGVCPEVGLGWDS